jgi:transposase-like protein
MNLTSADKQEPKTLQQAVRYFADEQTCIDTVAAIRWPNGPVCPKCQHREHYYLATQKRWKCKKCAKQFSIKSGTIFEDSAIPLDKWLIALWMLVNCKNGISSYEVGRALGLTQKSAWFVLHRLRLALQKGSLVKLGGPDGEVEVDETFIGGKARNMHIGSARRKQLDPRGMGGKTTVLGLLDRKGEVRATVVANRKRAALHGEIEKNVEPGSTVYTDNLMSYLGLPEHFAHKFIDHAERYVDGKVHTNGMENFWSLLKRGLKGTYISVEPFHLFRYLDEQTWRYNNRATEGNPVNDGDRFQIALSQIGGKRLTYAEVTSKNKQANANAWF